MTGYPRFVRLAVFAATLLHALAGGVGPWLHGAAMADGPVAHADVSVGGADHHGPDCALCHSATALKHAAPSVPFRLAAVRRTAVHSAPAHHAALPVRTSGAGGARAPPHRV